MYNIISAHEKHLTQIVPLLASTGYWEAGLRNNLCNLDPLEFMREYIAKPNLPFTHIIVNTQDEDLVLGVIVCASKKDISALPDFGEYVDQRIMKLFENFYKFEMNESYHISYLAISKQHRRKGLGKKLMEFAEQKGRAERYDTLSLYTFSCATSAVKLYLSMGMMITNVIHQSDELPLPITLYFEKNAKISAAQDYFETEDYEKLRL